MTKKTEVKTQVETLSKRVAELQTRSSAKSNEIRALTLANGKMRTESEEIKRYVDVLTAARLEIGGENVQVRQTPQPKRKLAEGVPHLIISDTHFDEVVEKKEMDGVNAYNRQIATVRLDKVFDDAISAAYNSHIENDNFVLILAGDMISGNIHEELAITNSNTPMETVVYWTNQLLGHIQNLSEHFALVDVYCVSGNHDRSTAKTPFKKRAETSYTWIMYSWIESHFLDTDSVTVVVSVSPEFVWEVAGKTYVVTHGDGFSAGNGVSGLTPGLIKSVRSLFNRLKETRNIDADWCVFGHFHTPIFHNEPTWGGFIMNSSLKGYDEYCRGRNLPWSPAAQCFWVATENGPEEVTYIDVEGVE